MMMRHSVNNVGNIPFGSAFVLKIIQESFLPTSEKIYNTFHQKVQLKMFF